MSGTHTLEPSAVTAAASEALIERIRGEVIGEGEAIHTPYGWRRLTYADYTASSRSLRAIEDAIRERVLPTYANVHTAGSHTGRRTTRLREQARETIRRAAGGDESTAVIFCGSGSTAAIDKLIGVLGLRLPSELERRHRLQRHVPAGDRPVVFVGPYEHHSNEIPWRESLADVVVVPPDPGGGGVDLAFLGRELARHADRPLRIGSFSAASNVTGVTTDVAAVTALLHEHGALSCWDFAAAAPHLPIAMVPRPGGAPGSGNVAKDAVFLSPHKLLGGPGTPGVLLVRRDLLRNATPTVPGGGTVSFVSPTSHRFVADVEEREEGGTPDIVGAVRAGLVFALRDRVGADVIAAREDRLARRMLAPFAATPGIEILGEKGGPRLAIVSVLVRDPRDPRDAASASRRRYLHHDFVVAVLSDLFGIQARGGCSCAGPYGHRLLDIDERHSAAFDAQVSAGWGALKPGWVRLSLSYVMSDAAVDYVCAAMRLVAERGHRLLEDYTVDLHTGAWRHVHEPPEPPGPFDADVLFPGTAPGSRRAILPEAALAGHLSEARHLLDARPEPGDDPAGVLPERAEALRWFPLPPDTEPANAAGRS